MATEAATGFPRSAEGGKRVRSDEQIRIVQAAAPYKQWGRSLFCHGALLLCYYPEFSDQADARIWNSKVSF